MHKGRAFDCALLFTLQAENPHLPAPLSHKEMRTGQFFGGQNFVANSAISWGFSGDPMGRPYKFRLV